MVVFPMEGSLENREDKELILLCQSGDGDAFTVLTLRYLPYIKAIVGSFNVPSDEFEDLLQEGLIGLYKAVMYYDIGKGEFRSFLSVCASRSMISALRRRKSGNVNAESENLETLDEVSDSSQEPERVLLSREELSRLQNEIRRRLSDLEYQIFTRYLQGQSYDEIAEELGKTLKSVDNAIARAKKKVNDLSPQ